MEEILNSESYKEMLGDDQASKKVPLTVNFDMNRPIGTAVVHKDGRVEMKITDPDALSWLTRGAVRGLSLSTIEVQEG